MANCQHPRLRYEEWDCVETHGLECGPYETWRDSRWTCLDCEEYWETGAELALELEAIEREQELAK